MDIADWLDPVSVGFKVNAANKRQALAAAAEIAARALGQQSEVLLNALLNREAEGSTGVGAGVAAPHAQIEGLDRMRAVFVRLEKPIDFDSLDEQPVDLMFVLFAPKGAVSEHLRALARVSRLMRQDGLRERLRQARSADALYALLSTAAKPSAA